VVGEGAEGPDVAIAKLEEAKEVHREERGVEEGMDGTLAVIGETEGKLETEMKEEEEGKEEAMEDVKGPEPAPKHEVPPLVPAQEETHGPVAAMEAMTQFVAEAASKGKGKGKEKPKGKKEKPAKKKK
jgi:hypothetical protein